ncbi:hypothetical protein D5086_013480 [Populus alba]|uniref:Uncharacterized protein n=1 Tax=Populus alba TaxID=43335 RepID=A0ACC4C5V8_POPAL
MDYDGSEGKTVLNGSSLSIEEDSASTSLVSSPVHRLPRRGRCRLIEPDQNHNWFGSNMKPNTLLTLLWSSPDGSWAFSQLICAAFVVHKAGPWQSPFR